MSDEQKRFCNSCGLALTPNYMEWTWEHFGNRLCKFARTQSEPYARVGWYDGLYHQAELRYRDRQKVQCYIPTLWIS